MDHVGVITSRVVIPLLGVGVLWLFWEHRPWAIMFAVLEVGLAVVGGSARTLPRVRAWALPVALFVAGGAAMLLPGALGLSAALLVAAVAVLAMVASRKTALLALALTITSQLGCGILAFFRLQVLVNGEPLSAPVAFAVTAAATLLAGLVIVSAWRRLEARWNGALSRAQSDMQDAQIRCDELEAQADGVIAGQRVLRQRVEYMEASLEATRDISAREGLGVLLEAAAICTVRSFGFAGVQIYLLDSTGEWATLVSSSHSSDSDAVVRGYRVRVDGDGPVAWAVRDRQPKVVRAQQGAWGGEGLSLPDGGSFSGPGTLLALPLMLPESGQALGILLVETDAMADFGKEALDILGSYASHLARLIDHARSVRDDAAALEVGGPLLGTASLLVAARTDSDVFDVIVDGVRDTGPDRVLIVRVLEDGEVVQVVLDYRGEQVERVKVDLVDFTPSGLVDLALYGLLLQSPLWAEDLNNLDPSLSPELVHALRELAQTTGSAALALVPLRAATMHAEGEIVVLYAKAHRFTVAERRLHQLLVDFGGAALERTRLLVEAQDRLDLVQQRSVIEARLGRAPDVPTILRVAVRDMGRALRAVDGEICLYPGVPGQAGDSIRGQPAFSEGGPEIEG